MKNIENIKQFMSKINPEWKALKKARYICINLCEIYSYSPEYNYGDPDWKDDFLMEIIQLINSGDDEQVKGLIDDEQQICVGIAAIYTRLLKQAGLKNVEQMFGDVFFELDEGKDTSVSIRKELYRVKLKERPEGFEKELLEQLEEIDKELGFIDEKGYKGKENYNVEEILKNESSFESRLDRVLADRGRYISTVIGRNLKNVELHKYYRYLMKTAFPRQEILIEPVDKEYIKGIQYALIAKPKDENSESLHYLYNREEGRFVKVSKQDIANKKEEEKAQESPELTI